MSTSSVRTYLEELTTVAEQRLGARRSAELVDEIGEHIDAAIAAGQPDTDVLDRLGSPREIVEAEVSEAPVPQQPRLRAQDVTRQGPYPTVTSSPTDTLPVVSGTIRMPNHVLPAHLRWRASVRIGSLPCASVSGSIVVTTHRSQCSANR